MMESSKSSASSPTSEAAKTFTAFGIEQILGLNASPATTGTSCSSSSLQPAMSTTCSSNHAGVTLVARPFPISLPAGKLQIASSLAGSADVVYLISYVNFVSSPHHIAVPPSPPTAPPLAFSLH